MSLTALILLMALATFGLRLLGFLLPAGAPQGFLARWLRYLPLAVFGTLIGVSVGGRNATDTVVRVVALAFGAWFFSRRMPLWLVLLLVMGGYVGFRLATR